MKRKSLYIIIAVLVVILIGALVFVFVMSNSRDDNQGTNPGTSDTTPKATDPVTGETIAVPGETETAQLDGDSEVLATDAPEVPAEDQPEQTDPEVPEDTRLIPDTPEMEVPVKDEVTYEDYHNMSGDEQAAFINTFESYEAFFAWYNAAEQEYRDQMIEIDGSTPIDLGGLNP